MSIYVLRYDSLALETCILSLISAYTLFLALAIEFHATHVAGLLLLMATCAYGICTTGVEHRKFSRCAAALGILSCIAAFAHTGFICEHIQTLHGEDYSDIVLPRTIPFIIGMIIIVFLKVAELGLAGVLVFKHARISMQQGPRNSTTMVPGLEMQDNHSQYYPPVVSSYSNLPATQASANQPAFL